MGRCHILQLPISRCVNCSILSLCAEQILSGGDNTDMHNTELSKLNRRNCSLNINNIFCDVTTGAVFSEVDYGF